MKNTIFTGAGVAIITPMLEDGSVDYAGLAKNIDFQIETIQMPLSSVVQPVNPLRWTIRSIGNASVLQ